MSGAEPVDADLPIQLDDEEPGPQGSVSLDDLDVLGALDADDLARRLGISRRARRPGRYERLTDVDVLDSGDGVRAFVRDDDVVLVYVAGDALAAEVTVESLAARAGRSVDEFRSRQGKAANLHVAARAGVAWSELDGRIGWVELFPPMSLTEYRRTIYEPPPTFVN